MRWLIRRPRREQVDGERGQPVLARVVAAGDVPQRRLGVAGRRRGQRRPGRVVGRQGRRDAPHAPGPAQVQPVEVDELRVGAVRHRGRREQRLRLAPGRPRQEPREPGPELGRRQHAPHQVRLHQARREEVGPGRLPPRRGVGVLAEVGPRPLLDQLPQPRVADRPGVVVGEGQPERGVRVHAGADRVGLLREELEVPRDDHVRERPEVLRPPPARPGRPSRGAPRPA